MRQTLSEFSALQVTGNLDNADLRRIIEKIVVNSKEEIYVYFKGNGSTPFNVPVRLSDSITIDPNIARGT